MQNLDPYVVVTQLVARIRVSDSRFIMIEFGTDSDAGSCTSVIHGVSV